MSWYAESEDKDRPDRQPLPHDVDEAGQFPMHEMAFVQLESAVHTAHAESHCERRQFWHVETVLNTGMEHAVGGAMAVIIPIGAPPLPPHAEEQLCVAHFAISWTSVVASGESPDTQSPPHVVDVVSQLPMHANASVQFESFVQDSHAEGHWERKQLWHSETALNTGTEQEVPP